jgi:hypothetical protein
MNVLSLRGYAGHRRKAGLSGTTLGSVQKALATLRITARPDGRIDARRADAEWERNTNALKVRKPRRSEVVPSPEPDLDAALPNLTAGQVTDGRRELLGRIRVGASILPEILLKLGAPMSVVVAATDALDTLLWAWLGERIFDELYPDADEGRTPEPDYSALAASAGLPIEPDRWGSEADAVIATLDELLEAKNWWAPALRTGEEVTVNESRRTDGKRVKRDRTAAPC